MNSDLWIVLFNEIRKRRKLRLKVYWCKGHQKNDDLIKLNNNIADVLADYKQFKEYEQDLPE